MSAWHTSAWSKPTSLRTFTVNSSRRTTYRATLSGSRCSASDGSENDGVQGATYFLETFGCQMNILDSQLIMPRFVLGELQAIADSGDKLRRSRGRRGLDILNRLRSSEEVDLKIYDREVPEMAGQSVDMKLVLLAKHLGGKIVTGDYNLNKVARLHNVPVINLNDIANALKPVYLPGEHFDVRIVKAGEEAGQGVGYLDDGTMIVVESGRDHINETVRIGVTSVLQTSAGRMIFGRYESTVRGGNSK